MLTRPASPVLGLPHIARLAGIGGLMTMLGCVGVITSPSNEMHGGTSAGVTGAGSSGSGANSGTGGAPMPVTFAPATGAYRRLTSTAFQNSLRDLLGGSVTVGELEPDSWSIGGFASVSAATVSISQVGVEDYQTAIEAATTQVFSDTTRRDKLLGCKPASVSDTTCFQSFVKTFGRLAWRQPLTAAQVTRYSQLVGTVASSMGDAYEGMRAGMSGLLQSPNFLYRLERGAAPASGGSSPFWQYTSREMASRLSYFLTNSTPDAMLLAAADSDSLTTADAVRQQADRLLSTTAGHESVKNFATELYQLGIIAGRAKDPTMYPQYAAALQNAMMQEIPAMFENIVFTQNGSALDLFTTRNTFVTKDLATLYGLPTTGLSSTTLSPATLPADGLRAGLLGTAGFLSLYASQKEGSPTQRGKFIRQILLCQTIPDPPANVNLMLPDPPAGVVLTKRQKLTNHEAVASCAVCHKLMDPLGLTLENFDAIGGLRSTDQGLPIDVSGNLDGMAFNGPIELGQALASQPATADCLVRNFYRYGTGHVETASEQPVLDALKAQFRSGGYHVRDSCWPSSPATGSGTSLPRLRDVGETNMPTKRLSRRTFLRGALTTGATITIPLPVLDIMLNGNGTAYASGTAIPRRYCTWFFGNGILPPLWNPAATGSGDAWSISQELMPLASYKNWLTVVSGLSNKIGNASPHPMGSAASTTGASVANNSAMAASIDQIVAGVNKGGSFPSLEVGCSNATPNGPEIRCTPVRTAGRTRRTTRSSIRTPSSRACSRARRPTTTRLS